MDRKTSLRIKAATVAFGLMNSKRQGAPFTIYGTGFCVDGNGLIVTCRHVLETCFVKPIEEIAKQLPSGSDEERAKAFSAMQHTHPTVFFYKTDYSSEEMFVQPVAASSCMVRTGYDLGMIRVKPHVLYPYGYPHLETESYEEIYEGMEVGTCGFPLGNGLMDQIGTFTSSFTFGRLSSILPANNVSLKQIRGFQLDITATNGNSGGPVFSTATGRVIGVLSEAVASSTNEIFPGIVKAEPVYPLLKSDGVGWDDVD